MPIQSYPTAKCNGGFPFPRLMHKVFLRVYAEETTPVETTDGGEGAPSVNFEQAIALARKEEKDKLYPRIKKLEGENKTLQESVNKYLLENAALKEEVEKLKKKPADSTVKELEDRIATLEEENKTLKENAPNEDEIRQRLEAEFAVKTYAQEQIAANKDSILSILIPEIKGKTNEEIDAAIAEAKKKTRSIKKDLGLEVDDDDDEDGEGEKKSKKKSTPEKKKQKRVPTAAPSSDNDGEEFDAEYIRNLDPRSKEYAEFRKKMGLK